MGWQAQIHMRRGREEESDIPTFPKILSSVRGILSLGKIAWWAIVHGLTESDTIERPSTVQDPFSLKTQLSLQSNSAFLLLDETRSPSIVPENRDLEP